MSPNELLEMKERSGKGGRGRNKVHIVPKIKIELMTTLCQNG